VLPLVSAQEANLAQKQEQIGDEGQAYEIRLLGKQGKTRLAYETICYSDDEAIDKLFAITHVPYVRFEITCAGDMISQGRAVNKAKARSQQSDHLGR
jgi:hypothetical protein